MILRLKEKRVSSGMQKVLNLLVHFYQVIAPYYLIFILVIKNITRLVNKQSLNQLKQKRIY